MAVLQMQRISVYALKKHRKAVLEQLQRQGAVEVTDLEEDGVFEKMDVQSSQGIFEKSASSAVQALESLLVYAPEKKSMLSMLEGRKAMSMADYEHSAGLVPQTMETASRILLLTKRIAENGAEVLRLKAQYDALTPWLPLNVSMRLKGTKTTAAFIGSFSEPMTERQLLDMLAQEVPQVPGVHVEIVSSSTDQTCVFILCMAKDGQTVEEALRGRGFTYPASPSKRSPAAYADYLVAQRHETEAQIREAEQEIAGYAGVADRLRFAADYFNMRADKYRVLGHLAQSRHVFILSGYLPAKNAAALAAMLESRFSAAVELETPGEDEDVPVALQNNAFAAPVESVLESYSLPGRGEIDPCSVMAVFYYVLFGMMLSDAAYGMIMVIACSFVLLKFRNLESGMKKAMKMFLYSGISTTFWGIMFGSYFGDAIEVVAKTFFNTKLVVPALWFKPVEEPMRLLVFCFLIGIIHLFTGLALQLYQLVKQKKYMDAFYDVVLWYFLVGGLIVLGLSSPMLPEMLGLTFILPAMVGNVAAALAVIGALGIIATAGRESRNPVKRILKGLYGLYNISGYLSDILSYSRLLALGLATGVIASVFNQMGGMFGGGVVGVIGFTLVFLVGHTMNIGINLLGAYVHTNRLQYVEFFGKFYSGGGRKFTPFAARTKYYKIEEDI